MSRYSLLAATLLVGGAVALLTTAGAGRDADAKRLLPGLQPDGFVLLPNQWKLRPTGTQTELGDFPVHAELHPSGDSTTVTIEVSFDGGPLSGPLGASVAASGEKAAAESLEKLKGLVS